VRTPKAGIIGKNATEALKKTKTHKVNPTVYFELILAGYFIIGLAISVYYMEIAAIPFQLMFFLGFGSVGYMSLKQSIQT